MSDRDRLEQTLQSLRDRLDIERGRSDPDQTSIDDLEVMIAEIEEELENCD